MMIELDVHTHLVPIEPRRLAAFDGIEWRADEETLVLDGQPLVVRSLFKPEALIAWMDSRSIARALVSVPPPVYRQSLPEAQAIEWVRYLNEELLRIAEASGGRLGALYYLPLEHPRATLALLQDCDERYAGVALSAGGHPGIVYSDACHDPLWRWLDERAAFVFMHPGACGDKRLAAFYLDNFVGNPYETGVSASHLVMAGVPARYPGIRFCLAHAGGIFPALCGRLEKGFDTARPGVDLEVERPLQAARRFWVDCIAHHPSTLRLAREVVGESHVLFGSDWPFPMGIDDPADVPPA